MKKRNIHIIDAIATYICDQSIKQGKMISNIETEPVIRLFGVTKDYSEIALKRARGIMNDFIKW